MSKVVSSVFFSCILILSACSSSSNVLESTKPEPVVEEILEPEIAETVPADGDLGSFTNPYPFGSSITIGKVGLNLGRIETNIEAFLSEYGESRAPDGFTWARVKLNIENLGNEKIDGSFLLVVEYVTSTGEAYEDELVFTDDGLYDMNTLYPGGKGSGYEYFILPKDGLTNGKWAVCVWGWPDRPCYEVLIEVGN